MMEEGSDKSLKELIGNVSERLDQLAGVTKEKKKKEKIKPFKFRYGVRVKEKNIARRKKILVFLLGTNRFSDAQIADIKDGYIVINGVPRRCSNDYIYLFGKKRTPCIFLPEWLLEPIGLEDYYKQNPDGLPVADAQRMVIGAIESGEALTKKKMEPKMVVIGLLVLIVVGYIVMGGAG